MEDGKRRTYICQQATAQAKKKQEEGAPPIGETGLLKSFMKRKMKEKVDCPKKKSRLVITTTVKETPLATKLPLALRHEVGKGLTLAKGPIVE